MNFGFACFGATDYVEFKTTLHYGAVVAKAPRAVVDQMCCRRLGRRLAEFCAFFISHRPEAHPMVSSKARDWQKWKGPIPPRGAAEAELVELNTAPFAGPLLLPELAPEAASSMPAGPDPISMHDSAGLRLGAHLLQPTSNRKVALVYTAMLDYAHGSTAAAAAYVSLLLFERGWLAEVSDDPAKLQLPSAPAYDLIVFVQNS